MSQEDLNVLEGVSESLRRALEKRFGHVEVSCDMQDRGDYKRFFLPRDLLTDPENPYACIVLSQSYGMACIPHEWDFEPSVLADIKRILAEQGLHYVSYRIFADPVGNHWRQEGETKLKHEKEWSNLFDYL